MSDIKIEAKADASGDKLDAIMSLLGQVMARQDEMEKNLPAKELVSASDKAKKDEEAKKGEEEKEKEAKKDEAKKEEAKEKADSEGKLEGEAGEMKFDAEKEEEAKKDEEEEAAKKDDEEAAMADCQAKADSVYSAFGKSASRPLSGENLTAYRKRLVRGLQAHSDEMKNVNINKIADSAMLDIVEKRVYADALAASRGTGAVSKGQLIALTRKDQAGRTITEYRGDMEAWLGDFKTPTHRVVKFNTENFKR